MRRDYLLCLLFMNIWVLASQIDDNSVLGIPAGTLTEINAITTAQEGSLAYATDTKATYLFDGTSWVALSLTNPTNVYFGSFVITGTGSQTINGLAFQPSQIKFVAHANVETLNLNSDNAVGNNNTGLANAFGTGNGFARDNGGSITQQCIYIGGSGNSINDISRYASSSHCVGIRYSNRNGDQLGLTTASITSFNLDGFTINVDNHSDDLVVLYEAYE